MPTSLWLPRFYRQQDRSGIHAEVLLFGGRVKRGMLLVRSSLTERHKFDIANGIQYELGSTGRPRYDFDLLRVVLQLDICRPIGTTQTKCLS